MSIYFIQIFIINYVYYSKSEQELEAYYRQKYAEASTADRYGTGEEMSHEITQQGLLPGVK